MLWCGIYLVSCNGGLVIVEATWVGPLRWTDRRTDKGCTDVRRIDGRTNGRTYRET
jgi:hypothetical protein